MIRTDSDLYLPPVEEINNFEKLREYLTKISGLLNNNQFNVRDDLSTRVDSNNPVIRANMNCSSKQMLNMVIENRTDDPDSPVEGQIWLRTDLL